MVVLSSLLGAGSSSVNADRDITIHRSPGSPWSGQRGSQDVAIPEWSGLEGTLKIILFQLEQSSTRARCSESSSHLALDVRSDGACTSSVHSLGQCLSTLSVKKQLP